MDIRLTDEQQYMLCKVRLEAQSLNRDQLIEALCDSWEARYRLQHVFQHMGESLGMGMQIREEFPWLRPETEEEFKDVLGYVPTDQEAKDYLNGLWENARMEIDMDEIVLTPDDKSAV